MVSSRVQRVNMAATGERKMLTTPLDSTEDEKKYYANSDRFLMFFFHKHCEYGIRNIVDSLNYKYKMSRHAYHVVP
jgi:hypothetical protein